MHNIEDIIRKFEKTDKSDIPEFCNYKKPLDQGLWVLLVSKEKLRIRKLTAEQIASIIRDVMEVSTEAESITKSFNKAEKRIHTYKENGETYYEIMRKGKEYLKSLIKEGSIDIFYFEPDNRYTCKKILSKNILKNLNGKLRIVDPYCSDRTLDVLEDVENNPTQFLTRVENLSEKKRNQFLRTLQDFKSENKNIEFRNYTNTDIHDRYVISNKLLIILGHSIKDLGAKESFVVMLNKETSKNIFDALIQNFDRRWRKSSIL